MKRFGGFFERITDRSTISGAAHRAAKGKMGKDYVSSFMKRIDHESNAIIEQLIEGTDLNPTRTRNQNIFGDYSQFMVRDTKTRVIHAPSFRERVIHHAIIEAIGPILEKGAYRHSYACRKGFGQHAAIRQARRWLEPDLWYLKLDIRKFYDSVDHQTLKTMLNRRFSDRRLLTLVGLLIDSYESAPGKGIPIGAFTSQYFGNFYLDYIDRWIKQTASIRRYLRYMDDLLLIGEYRYLKRIQHEIPAILECIKLGVKHGGELNRTVCGVPFLGFVLFPNRTALNERGKKRLRKRLNQLDHSVQSKSLTDQACLQSAQSMIAHAKWDSRAVRRATATVARRDLLTSPNH